MGKSANGSQTAGAMMPQQGSMPAQAPAWGQIKPIFGNKQPPMWGQPASMPANAGQGMGDQFVAPGMQDPRMVGTSDMMRHPMLQQMPGSVMQAPDDFTNTGPVMQPPPPMDFSNSGPIMQPPPPPMDFANPGLPPTASPIAMQQADPRRRMFDPAAVRASLRQNFQAGQPSPMRNPFGGLLGNIR